MDIVTTKENKEVRINVKISPTKRREFQIAAELRGGTVSGLIHQFIVRTIHEEKQQHPEVFQNDVLVNGRAILIKANQNEAKPEEKMQRKAS